MYAYLVEGEIQRTEGSLPLSWRFADGRSTGNFNLLPSEVHVAEGWWPIVDDVPTYDPEIEQLGDPILTVGDEIVTRSWEVVEKPPAVQPEPGQVERLTAAVTALAEFVGAPDLVELSNNNLLPSSQE